MKREFLDEILPSDWQEGVDLVRAFWQRHPVAVGLFLALCLNSAIAPAVHAATGETLSRTAAWAIGLLGIVTLGLSIYLFAVIFQPERF